MTSFPRVSVVGLPLDEHSSFLRGAAGAPAAIRSALHDGSSNLTVESGLDLKASDAWIDVGDLALSSGAAAIREIEQGVRDLVRQGRRVLGLGGDHSVTYPAVRATAPAYPGLSILHLDAHPDIYENYDDNPYSHASPFARIMEDGLVHRLVQVGIRTATPHQREQFRRYSVEVIEMKDWSPAVALRFDGPVYLSLDVDAIDPAFAPGVSHHEPGGLSTRDVIRIIQTFEGLLVGADIVEINPLRDVQGITAMLGAKLYKEIVARLLRDE